MSCNIKRILQFKEAISYQTIQVYSHSDNITNSCMYSWSSDGACWTNWSTFDMYNRVCKQLGTDFYLRVLLLGDFEKISLNGVFTNCYSICLDSSSTFLTDFCAQENLFQPYNNLDCALLLQQQLADSVVCMFGIPIYYFRVNPNEGATDYTFKEHFLHHIEAVKQIKLMISDGQMPSSNPKLTEFDFDWETDWETELSKTQFANAFGDNAYPKSGDFLYIPLMKRMWEVNSAYDEKNEGLLWRSTTWKLSLVKYTEATNVDPSAYDDLIDSWVQHYEDVFGEVETKEQIRETGSYAIDSPKFAATNLYNVFMEDSVRKQYTKEDVDILDKSYNHRSNVVSRNIYKFKNPNGCIVYQNTICGNEGTIIFIIETPGSLKNVEESNILEFGEVRVRMQYTPKPESFKISFGNHSCELEPFKSYMVILKWNKNNYSEELNVYNYKHPDNVPVYKIRPMMYWFDFENPICELTGPYNNDYDMRSAQECIIHAYPMYMTNIKYYSRALSNEESIKESIKYTTTHDSCVINDLARPIYSGHGYTVK